MTCAPILLGGVPVAEVEANRALFEALGFDPNHAFAKRSGDPTYYDFGPPVPDRKAVRPLVEQDEGVAARRQALLDALALLVDSAFAPSGRSAPDPGA